MCLHGMFACVHLKSRGLMLIGQFVDTAYEYAHALCIAVLPFKMLTCNSYLGHNHVWVYLWACYFVFVRLWLQCWTEYMQMQCDYCCLSCFCVFTLIYIYHKALKNCLIINNCISVLYVSGELLWGHVCFPSVSLFYNLPKIECNMST